MSDKAAQGQAFWHWGNGYENPWAMRDFRRCVELNPKNEYATGKIKVLEEGLK